MSNQSDVLVRNYRSLNGSPEADCMPCLPTGAEAVAVGGRVAVTYDGGRGESCAHIDLPKMASHDGPAALLGQRWSLLKSLKFTEGVFHSYK